MAQTENYKLYVVGAGEDPYVKDFVEQLCGENASNMTIIDNALQELKTSVSEGKALVSSAVTDMGVSTADDATYATIASNIKNISNDATASTGEILSGETAYSGGKKITGTMANQGAKTATLNCGGSYTIPAGYHNGSGKITANSLASQTNGTAVAGDILAGKTAYVDGVKITGTIATQGAKTITPSTSVQTAVPSGIYTTGAVTVSAVPTQTKSVSPTTASQTVTPDNGKFLSSVSVGAISTQTKSVTPTTSIQTVSPDSGKYLTSVSVGAIPNTYVKPSVTKAATTYTPTTSNQTIAAGTYCSGIQTIAGDSDLVSGNIRSGANIFGVAGSPSVVNTSDATATESYIASGKTAYVNGSKITGNVTEVTSSDAISFEYWLCAPASDGIGVACVADKDNLIRKDAVISIIAPKTEFGDATAADVAAGKTFTSAAGLFVTGTMQASSVTEDGYLIKVVNYSNVEFNYRYSTYHYLDIPAEYIPSDIYTGTTTASLLFTGYIASLYWGGNASQKTIFYNIYSDSIENEGWAYSNNSEDTSDGFLSFSQNRLSYSASANDGVGGYTIRVATNVYTAWGDGTGTTGDLTLIYKSNQKYANV